MNGRFFTIASALTLTAGLGAIACGQAQLDNALVTDPAIATDAAPVELTVSVAASVQDAMREIQLAYQDTAPHVTVTYNFGSSGSLAQQIVQGAPADIFLSASQKWMDDLEDTAAIADGSRVDLLQNSMVLVAPADKIPLASLQDIASDDVNKIAIGEPESVPAGRYAKEVLTSLGLFDSLQSSLVFGKDVRQILAYVETGNVDAGLVYATDAQLSDQVETIATAPAATHTPIVYPIGIVAESDDAEAAQAFIDFLTSDPAIAIFQGYGFGMAE